MMREGHEIASHGYDHALLTFASRRRRAPAAAHGALAAPIALGRRRVRCSSARRTASATRSSRARPRAAATASWAGRRASGTRPSPASRRSSRRTIGGFRPGGILLLHDADGSGAGDDRSQTADAVPEIVERAHAAGYELVTVSELAARAPARRTATWRIIAGLVLFGVLIELALRSVDIEHGRARSTSAWWWVIAALGLNLASILLKAVVWKAALDTIPHRPRFHYVHVVPALFIGFLLNTLLPARLGEIGRIAVLRRRLKLDGHGRADALRSPARCVAEQIVLAIALVAIMLLQLPFVNVPARFENMILAFGGVVIVVLLAVIALEAFSRKSRRAVRPDYAFKRGQQALAMLYPIARGMQQGQTVLRRPRTAAWALVAGLASWAAQIGGIYAALEAADIHASIGTAGLVFLVSTLVQLFPFWPGNIGLFQAAVAQVARAGVPDRLPPRDRVRGRAAGDRGGARRRPRLLVPLARGPVAVRGTRPARRGLTGALETRTRVGTAFVGGHVPPRGGGTAT